MRRVLRNVGKILFYSSVSLLAVVLLLLNIVLFRPQLLVNDNTLSLAARLLKMRGITLQWQEGHLVARSLSLWKKQINLSLQKLQGGQEGIDLSLDEFQLSVEIALDSFSYPVHSIGPLVITGGQLKVESKSKKSSANAKPGPSTQVASVKKLIPDWVRHAQFKGIAVEFVRYEIDTDEVGVSGSARVSGQPETGGSSWEVDHDTDVIQNTGQKMESMASLKGSIRLKSLETLWDGPYRGNLSEQGTVLGDKNLSIDINVEESDQGVSRYFSQFRLEVDKKPIQANVRGTYSNKTGLDGIIEGSISKLIPELPKIALDNCRFTLSPSDRSDGMRHSLSLNCPVLLTPKLPEVIEGLGPSLVGKVRVLLASDLEGAIDSAIKGTIRITIDELSSPIAQGHGGAKIDVNGTLKNFPNSLNPKTQIDLGLTFPEFQTIVRRFGKTRSWAVPEPLSGLKGPIDLTVKGEGELPWDLRLFPIVATTRLTSPTQRLSVDASGTLEIKDQNSVTDITLKAQVILSDIKLALPRLDLAAPPRLIPDNRIQTSQQLTREAASKPSVVFHHEITIKTPKDHPILLTSNLAKRDIPINVDLSLINGEPTQIKLNISGFPVNVFRREAVLEYFGVHSSEDGKRMVLNGRLRVVYTDYTIFINISGNTDAPKVEFTSEPHLADQQVIAVLFFGKTIDQLEPGQMDSVNNTKAAIAGAAIANSAVSLASMYLLASTPIESVGYDPLSGVMSAKVHLADGTSLNVGSDFRQLNTLGIRRRLGPNWAITTYLDNPFDQINRTLNAFIEWNKRY